MVEYEQRCSLVESSNLYKCNRDEKNGKCLFNTKCKWDNKFNTALTLYSVIGEHKRSGCVSSVALLKQSVSWLMKKLINVNIYKHLSSVKNSVNTCCDTH